MLQGTTEIALSLLDVLEYMDKIPVCTAYEIEGIDKYKNLPENHKRYVEFIENEVGYPIKLIYNGPRRVDIILKYIECDKDLCLAENSRAFYQR